MIGYRLPAADAPMTAAEHASMRRLLPAGPWRYSAHPQGGTLAMLDDGGERRHLRDLGAPRETADGLLYYPPKQLPTVAELVRKAPPQSIAVELSSGVTVPIAIAMASPRRLVFEPTGIVQGDYLTEYARLTDELREKLKRDGDVMRDDPLLHRVVLLALQQCLRVTEELLTDLGWVSTADFLPIFAAALGHDEKKAHGVGSDAEPSPLPAPASPTSR